jgi:hypothetical protein
MPSEAGAEGGTGLWDSEELTKPSRNRGTGIKKTTLKGTQDHDNPVPYYPWGPLQDPPNTVTGPRGQDLLLPPQRSSSSVTPSFQRSVEEETRQTMEDSPQVGSCPLPSPLSSRCLDLSLLANTNTPTHSPL